MRRLVLLILLMTAVGAARAEAITVREIIELSKTGLSDEVLLALIDIERKVFPVDSETVKLLKDAGVSERVILAMIRSGRARGPEAEPAVVASREAAPAPQPQVVVIEHRDQPYVGEVGVPVPVYVTVPVYVRTPRYGHGRAEDGDGRRVHHEPAASPAPSIGLVHGRLGLAAPPPKPTSDPPGWRKSPYLK